jgi:hypothetical protein
MNIFKKSIVFTMVGLMTFAISSMLVFAFDLSNSGTLPKVGGSACKVAGEYETEWHFIIAGGGGGINFPSTIQATFEDAGLVNVPLTFVNGPASTAGYTLTTGLTDTLLGATAVLPEGYSGNFVLSHWPCVAPLEVSKTADTSYTRTWDWSIDKTANSSNLGLIESGVATSVDYTVAVDASSTDSNFEVSGTITITNPNIGINATIESVADTLDVSEGVVVDCGVSFPYVLNAEQSLTCTYTTEVPNTDDTLNTVVVTTSGTVPGNSDTAGVVWSEPSNEIDECIAITDDKQGALGTVCASDEDKDFSYTTSFSKDGQTDVVWACNQTEYSNTASFISNDTQSTGNDTWVVTGEVKCVTFCSYSQGYWFAKPNIVWPQSLTIGGYTYTQAEGLAIWKSSNAKTGITDAKKAFSQYAAIQLSAYSKGVNVPVELQGYVNTINTFLTGKPKITGNNITTKNPAVSAAASAISSYIEAHHCVE